MVSPPSVIKMQLLAEIEPKKSNGSVGGAGAMDEDSDEDDDDAAVLGKMEDLDDKDVKSTLNPEDAKYQGELADGVGRIKVRHISTLT